MIRRGLFTALLVIAPRAAWACPVCFGQSDSPLANATNLGIIAMLGVVGVVLSGFAAFIVHLNRRARLVASGAVSTDIGTTTPQEGTVQC